MKHDVIVSALNLLIARAAMLQDIIIINKYDYKFSTNLKSKKTKKSIFFFSP